MYTTIRHELRHARKAWPGTLVDPCLLSGTSSPSPHPDAFLHAYSNVYCLTLVRSGGGEGYLEAAYLVTVCIYDDKREE
jgi:hypothetical protein